MPEANAEQKLRAKALVFKKRVKLCENRVRRAELLLALCKDPAKFVACQNAWRDARDELDKAKAAHGFATKELDLLRLMKEESLLLQDMAEAENALAVLTQI